MGRIDIAMAPSRFMIGILAAAGLTVAAMGAHAQQAPARIVLVANDFSGQVNLTGSTVPRRTLEWDARKGRWGLKLGVEQHLYGDVELRDLQPGVYYRVTPRLHIGGAVSLAPDQVENQRLTDPQRPAPRVRLETTFKF
jgi:hypothetical protein